ncbi:hypothetical protein [Microbispora triticiradicis]|uniref:hypothetical protein n=1 Tax=Microbispora triticiradicis TaxID=2200763 RepID=UPI001AD6166A|nr:hypothetical protein [Microbispora triticiradicis]MBO4269847.1 hypothetical protein [Microbispora triticiradicis]
MSNADGAAWITSAAVVSTLALLFTIASFWWLNARQGKLKSFEPHSFAGSITPQSTSIRLPIVFFNTGPKPIVVQNMRLAFPEDPGVTFALPWRNSRKQFRPATDDFKDFPAVFSVTGRAVVEVFADFGAPFASAAPELRDQKVRLEVKLGHKLPDSR